MKTINFFKTSLTFLAILSGSALLASDLIEFEPADLDPDADGWYLSGGYVYEITAEGDTTSSTFYDGCDEEYDDADHWETGTQKNFYYKNAIIMPACWPLDVEDANSDESNVTKGYIQLGKTKYTKSYGSDNDSSQFAYILSPSIENLDSFSIQVSPDVTYNEKTRKIQLDIEYSTDGGETWSWDATGAYIQLEVQSKFGEEFHLNTNNSDWGKYFDYFQTVSQSSPIIIRFMSTDNSYENQGSQRVKIHNVKIYADEATTAIDDAVEIDQITITVRDHTISTADGSQIAVYNYLGQTMGIGTSVSVQTGIYIVRTADGQAQKVLVK